MSDTEEFEKRLIESFVESAGVEAHPAAEAASKAAAFRGDHDEDLTAEDVLAALESAPYDTFQHDFDWVIGDFASAAESCTDSRSYRLAGFGDLAAEPEQGA